MFYEGGDAIIEEGKKEVDVAAQAIAQRSLCHGVAQMKE